MLCFAMDTITAELIPGIWHMLTERPLFWFFFLNPQSPKYQPIHFPEVAQPAYRAKKVFDILINGPHGPL